jgi:hypothetical protein
MSNLPPKRFFKRNRLLKRNKVSLPDLSGGGTLPPPRPSCLRIAKKRRQANSVKMGSRTPGNGTENGNLNPRFNFHDPCKPNLSQSSLRLHKPTNENLIEAISSQANNFLHRFSALDPGGQSKFLDRNESRKISPPLIEWRFHPEQCVITITPDLQKT